MSTIIQNTELPKIPTPEIIDVAELGGENTVKFLLSKLRLVKAARNVELGYLELQLQELQDKIHQNSLPFDIQSETIELEIKRLMPAINKTIKTEHGAALWRKGSTRVSYDTKALDACADEYVRTTILPYRKVTPVSPSMSIEVY